jgi:hypothetical protein
MTYFLSVFDPPKWLIKKIDRIRRSFLWCGEENASGAKCLVNWKQVCSPKEFGGLGVKDLHLFSNALRLRWAWLAWNDPERPWHGLPLPVNQEDLVLFHACTSIKIGNGAKALFWKDAWLDDRPLQQAFPDLFKLARRKNMSVKDTLHNGRWRKGLQRLNSAELVDDFVALWEKIQSVYLTNDEDTIEWTKTADKNYSASSAYAACFSSKPLKPLLAAVWDVRAEGKISFFLWLILQNRL